MGHRLKRSWGEFQALTVEQLGLPRLAHAHAQALAPELLEAERDVVAETQHQETALAPDLNALLPQECPDGLCRDEVVKHAGTRPAGHVGRRSGQQLEPVRPALPCPVETGIQGGQMRREPGHDGVAAAVIDLHGRIMSGCRTLVKYSGFYSSGASRDCLARSEPPTLLRRGAGMIRGTLNTRERPFVRDPGPTAGSRPHPDQTRRYGRRRRTPATQRRYSGGPGLAALRR